MLPGSHASCDSTDTACTWLACLTRRPDIGGIIKNGKHPFGGYPATRVVRPRVM